jgi:hypothetical protein
MSWTHRLNRAGNAGFLAIVIASAPLGTLAGQRADAVEQGPAAHPTAKYTLDNPTDSLLAPGSDPRLRVRAEGDLSRATHIAVLVPGVGHTPAEFDTSTPGSLALPSRAHSLWQAAQVAPDPPPPDDAAPHLAVVAWLGYVPPSTTADALYAGPIRPGAANLVQFHQVLQAAYPDAQVTWVCHSYGTLVCASALVGADPDALVLLGSPGMMLGSVEDLATTAPVFAARGGRDPIRLSQVLDVAGGGFGADPASAGFGAQLLPVDAHAGHSDYFDPGSQVLTAVAEVVTAPRRLGESPAVS